MDVYEEREDHEFILSEYSYIVSRGVAGNIYINVLLLFAYYQGVVLLLAIMSSFLFLQIHVTATISLILSIH